jgi:Leucine-rich repeat (LRR) protein
MKQWFILTVFFMAVLLFGTGNPPKGTPQSQVPGFQPIGKKAAVVPGFGKIPLYFIANQGQVDEQTLFYARTSRYTLWVTKQGLVFDSIKKGDGKIDKRDVSRFIFLNANPCPGIAAEKPSAHRVNYLQGNDKSRWYTGIPTSERVWYKNLYKNIDLKVYGVEKEIEYDWIVKPTGNPQDIRFAYRNIKKSFIDEAGNLVIRSTFGEWVHKKPAAYQVIDGKRAAVEVSFTKAGNSRHTYGFKVSPYNRDYELIIDPMIIAFSTYLGGNDSDNVKKIVIDGNGSIYAAGYTASTDFPTVNAYQGSMMGIGDAFITKYSPDGSSLVYSTYLGGSQVDEVFSIAIDGSGAAYITGCTNSSDFPTMNPYQSAYGGGNLDAFIAKISPDGSSLLYSTYLGGSYEDWSQDIAVNSSGEIYVTGYTDSSDFPLQNALQPDFNAGMGVEAYDAFVTKFSASGSSLVYSTYLGGSGGEYEESLEIDNSGNVYVSGHTNSTDFPLVNAYQASLGDTLYGDTFLSKIAPDGLSLSFSTYLGGNDDEYIFDIDVDTTGVYVTGTTWSTTFPTTANAYQPTKQGDPYYHEADAFVSKFTLSGSNLVYSTFLGGSDGTTYGRGIALGPDGSAYITGSTSSPNFPLVNPTVNAMISGWDAAIITRFLPDGSDIDYSSAFGGENETYTCGSGVQVDTAGNIYLAGGTSGWVPIYNAIQPDRGSYGEGFIMKIIPSALDSITVIAPNGNETFFAGSTQTIQWTAPEVIKNVMIYYSTDYNREYWTAITESTPNTGSYSWTVPYTDSAYCLIAVNDAYIYNPLFQGDTSDAVFAITIFPIRLTSPNGGENWAGGSTHNITWADNGTIANVSIAYSTDSGNSWIPIADSIPNTGSYSWTVPETPSTSCLVKISDPGETNVDWSDSVFTIYSTAAPYIEVTSPNGGEEWVGGTLHAITWLYTGPVANVDIDYSTDGGSTWIPVADAIVNTGSYEWTIPPAPSATCLVRVSHAGETVSDVSNAGFTVKAPPIPQAERDALIAIYNSTAGTYWTYKNNWRNPENPSEFNVPGTEYSWYGVHLNSDYSHVEIINLSNNNLTGSIPDLSALTYLKELYLGTNNLSGNIPVSLNSLTNLTKLHLYQNSLYGSLPDLGALSNLVFLGVDDNSLSGNIPVWLNNLIKLEYLWLDNNSFSGTIPDLSGLTQLKSLILGNNNLTAGSIPTWINNLSQLKQLSLFNINLTGTIPDLGNLLELENLDLHDNQLTGAIPSWITTLPKLVSLYLQDNRLTGSIPVELGQLTTVHTMYLDGNNLTGSIPTSLSNLTGLYSNNFDIRWNGVYTTDSSLRDFLNTKQVGGNWESTQTIAPAGVSTGEVNNTSVKLTWTPIVYQADTGGYQVYYSTTSGSGYTLAGTTASKSANNYTVTGLNQGTQYYFVIKTLTQAHTYNQNTITSENSEEVSATTLAPTLTLTAPNGGETWEGTTAHNITWTSTGTIANVKLEYSTNSGSSWNTIIDSTTNSGTYNWTVPNTPSAACLVRITDTAGTANDISDAVFTITAQRTVTVTAPNGGQRWFIDTTYAIAWSSTGSISNVKIEYSTTSGSSWNTIIASTSNTGTYNWTVPNTPSVNCLVRIGDTSGTASDTSDSVFTIDPYPTVTVTAPNGGETWIAYTTHAITWTNTGTIATVNLEYSTNNGTSWTSIATSVTNTGSYDWEIPYISSTNCLVRVSDTTTTASDTSNAVFTLELPPSLTVTSPNGGESWVRRSTHTITWTWTGTVGDVKIQYTLNAGSSWTTITSSTPNDGSYQWTLPNVTSNKTQCLVKIEAINGSAVDTSDAYFTILK